MVCDELHRLRDYYFKTDQLSYWKDGANEVDIIVHNKDKFRLAIEIKSGEIHPNDLRGIKAFKERFPNLPSIVASIKDSQERVVGDGIKIPPWKAALYMAFDLMS